jgi:hypothetical protein
VKKHVLRRLRHQCVVTERVTTRTTQIWKGVTITILFQEMAVTANAILSADTPATYETVEISAQPLVVTKYLRG